MNEQSNALQIQPQTAAQMNLVNLDESEKLMGISSELFKSGMFPNVKSPAGAFAVAQYGFELGLNPMTALQNISVIKGKFALNSQAMLMLAKSRGVTYKVVSESDLECTLEFKAGSLVYVSSFSIDDAKKAGLIKDGGAWKTYPRDMLFWRAVSRGVRRVAPEALGGLYLPEEIESIGQHQGPEKAKNVTPKQTTEYQPSADYTPPQDEHDPVEDEHWRKFFAEVDVFQQTVEAAAGGYTFNHAEHYHNKIKKWFVSKGSHINERAIAAVKSTPDSFVDAFAYYCEQSKKEGEEAA